MRTKSGNKDQEIIKASLKVIAEEGFYNAKISKIAEIAKVATGSVYLYFESKDEILNTIFTNVWTKALNEANDIVKRKDISPIEKLEGIVDALFDMFTEDANLALVFINEHENYIKKKEADKSKSYERFLDVGEQIIKEGIREKEFNANIDVRIIRNFLFGGVRQLLHLWAQDNEEYPLNSIRRNVKVLLKRGILK